MLVNKKASSDNSNSLSGKKFDTMNSTMLKGIAIILMMFHHNFRDVSLFKNYEVSFWPFPQWLMVDLCNSFKICVSLFVFITGYGLYLSYASNKQSVSKWIVKREIKMLSGFWFIVIVSSVVCQILNGRTSAIYFKEGVLYGIFKWLITFFGLSNLFGVNQLNGTWWYMSAAVVYIIMIPVFSYYLNKFGPVLSLSLIVILPRILGISYTGGNSAYAFLLILGIGITAAKYDLVNRWLNYANKTMLQKIIKCIAELLLCGIAFKVYPIIPENLFYEVRYAVIPLIIILFCVEFINYIPGIRQILYFLGKHSMNVFLIHTFIRAYYYADFTYSFGNFAVISFVLLFVSVGISLVIEGAKKLIRYDAMINKLIAKVTK